jgi:Xaa-Pro dipeptidase
MTDTVREKMKTLLTDRALEGAIIYSEGTCSILSPSYLHYFSGVRPLGPRNAAVLTAEGAVCLLVDPPWDSARMAAKSWITDVRGAKSFTDDLIGILTEYRLSNSPVALIGGREMPEAIYERLSAQVKLDAADALFETIAKSKSPRELAAIYRAARIADIGYEVFIDAARPGMKETELVAEIEFAMRAAGADDIFILISSGPHNYEMHEPTDRRLRKGDIIIGEITPVVDGQFFQLCRTVVLGKPPAVVADKYLILLHALDESLAQIKPGVESSSLSKAMNRVIGEAGYGDYCYPPYMRARGHGFGVGSIAPGGAIDDDTKTPFERLQVVVVHPNQYLPETGYLACGETVLVETTGIQRLAATETRLVVKEV